jgi:hypothetical protein
VTQNLGALAVPTPTLNPLVAASSTGVTSTTPSSSSGPPPVLFIIGGIVAIAVGYGLAGMRRPRRT